MVTFLSFLLHLVIGIILSGISVLFPLLIYVIVDSWIFILFCASNFITIIIYIIAQIVPDWPFGSVSDTVLLRDASVNKTDENLSLIVAFILVGGGVERQYTINIIRNKLYSMLEQATFLYFSFCLLPLPAIYIH